MDRFVPKKILVKVEFLRKLLLVYFFQKCLNQKELYYINIQKRFFGKVTYLVTKLLSP